MHFPRVISSLLYTSVPKVYFLRPNTWTTNPISQRHQALPILSTPSSFFLVGHSWYTINRVLLRLLSLSSRTLLIAYVTGSSSAVLIPFIMLFNSLLACQKPQVRTDKTPLCPPPLLFFFQTLTSPFCSMANLFPST